MSRISFWAAVVAACAVLLLAGGLGGEPLCAQARQSKPGPWLIPDLAKSKWLVVDNFLEDASHAIPWKDTYVEVWQTTGRLQGPDFCRAYQMTDYLDEKFLFFVFRLLNNGAVFQVNIEIPNTTGVCLVDTQGTGVFEKKGSIYDNPQMPPWAKAASRLPKTFHPLPVLTSATVQGIQKLDLLPQIPGKETTVRRYRLSDGSHVFIKFFPNGTVWGYDLTPPNSSKVFYWSEKWNRSYGRKGGPPRPDFADYGLTPR
jgi:hypothetical protein